VKEDKKSRRWTELYRGTKNRLQGFLYPALLLWTLSAYSKECRNLALDYWKGFLTIKCPRIQKYTEKWTKLVFPDILRVN
jgi:hypothetical protein